MKKLVCELCGSNDIVKQDGFFVCECCGTKYSLEEAKKIMVDISGSSINIANQAQFNNLVKLANAALDSNNFAEAEKQANLALAINATDYDTYLIKARAIDCQTNGEKSRLLEVFNCYLTAYEVLEEEKKEERKKELFTEIVNSLKNEISFWVNQVEAQRPTNKSIELAKSSLVDSESALSIASDKFKIDITATLDEIKNVFISSVSSMANSAWESTVAYNYYRDSLYDYGKHWKRRGEDRTDDYRPMTETMDIFKEEVDNLIELMEYAISNKNDDTDLLVLSAIYSNMAFFREKVRDSVSFVRYSYSDSYGGYYEYWTLDRYWTDNTKSMWNTDINKWNQLSLKMKQLDEEKKRKIAEEKRIQEEKEAKERFEKYWENHKDEKQKFELEKEQIQNKVIQFEKEIKEIPGNSEIEQFNKVIAELKKEKHNLGLFKLKERKVIQEKINEWEQKVIAVKSRMENAKKEIEGKIEPLVQRIKEIETELTKPR